jgi:hypothetical protein
LFGRDGIKGFGEEFIVLLGGSIVLFGTRGGTRWSLVGRKFST